jgi:hypothetical protein
MLRVLVLFLALCCTAHSEERGPREAENKAKAAQANDQPREPAQQITVPANNSAPTIINIYAGKHADDESSCAKPKDWKEWGSFAWCRSLEWIDAERVIAVWTIILGIATCTLGIATWRLWKSTDRLVRGADMTSERQLRAFGEISYKDEFEKPRRTRFCASYGGNPDLLSLIQEDNWQLIAQVVKQPGFGWAWELANRYNTAK